MSRQVDRVLAAGLFIAACAALANSPLGAQQTGASRTRCTLVQQPNTHVTTDSTAAGNVAHFGGGVHFICPSRNIELRGDSAEQFFDHDALIGNAVFDDPRVHVTSDFLNYFPDSEKVVAVGNVHARMPSGSTLVGPIAVYYRAVPRVRTRAIMQAKARPTITLVEKDSLGRPTEPMTVIADSVLMDGDSLIYGRGQVVITRPQITATADSVFVDETKETMRLMRDPQLKGNKDRPFTLKGDLIDLYSTNKKIQRVIARANAIAVSDSLTLKSDTIDLRMKDDLLDHAYVWGKTSRARATSPSQNILADSLDVTMPGQQIRLVHALGKAFAQGRPDTLHFTLEKPDTTDWLRGDTIIAHFDSLPGKAPKDTTKNPRIKQLVATGHASAYYHLAPSDTSERRPTINYTTARLITIDFAPASPTAPATAAVVTAPKNTPGTVPPKAQPASQQSPPQKVATVTAKDSIVGVLIEPIKVDSTGKRAPGNATPGKTPTKPAIPASIVPLPPPRPPSGETAGPLPPQKP
jgi:lipopolysaccharide export system protein LptA